VTASAAVFGNLTHQEFVLNLERHRDQPFPVNSDSCLVPCDMADLATVKDLCGKHLLYEEFS
jgi:hypothetical protein